MSIDCWWLHPLVPLWHVCWFLTWSAFVMFVWPRAALSYCIHAFWKIGTMKDGFYKLCSLFVAFALPFPRFLVNTPSYTCGASFPVFTVPRCQSTNSLSSRRDDGILLEIIPNWRTTESLCRGILSDHGCLCVVQVNHRQSHVHTDSVCHDCKSRPKGYVVYIRKTFFPSREGTFVYWFP